MSPTKQPPVGQDYLPLGTSSPAVAWVSLDMSLGWIAVSLLEMTLTVPMLAVPRYALRQAGENHPNVHPVPRRALPIHFFRHFCSIGPLGIS